MGEQTVRQLIVNTRLAGVSYTMLLANMWHITHATKAWFAIHWARLLCHMDSIFCIIESASTVSCGRFHRGSLTYLNTQRNADQNIAENSKQCPNEIVLRRKRQRNNIQVYFTSHVGLIRVKIQKLRQITKPYGPFSDDKVAIHVVTEGGCSFDDIWWHLVHLIGVRTQRLVIWRLPCTSSRRLVCRTPALPFSDKSSPVKTISSSGAWSSAGRRSRLPCCVVSRGFSGGFSWCDGDRRLTRDRQRRVGPLYFRVWL